MHRSSCAWRARGLFRLTVTGVLALALSPSEAHAGSGRVLPVERVRMYETGVAFFQRAGDMAAGRGLELPLPAGHLDDALKTLVLLSPGGQAKIGGVAFETAVSEGAARAFAGLPDEGEDRLDYEVVLRSLEGREVEVRLQKGSFRARLLEVEGPLPLPPTPEGQVPTPRAPQFALVLLDASGALRRVRSEVVASLRPMDDGDRERIEIAAASLSGQSAQRRHRLSLQVERPGRVELGYVAEAPVWRTSYRVILTDDGQALMQAWALIHNDTDERWKGVEIELANGEPASFLFPLAAPRYARRELRAPEIDLYTVPQLLLETADGMWADGRAFGEGSYGVGGSGGLGISGYGRGGGGSAGGALGVGSVASSGAGSLQLGDLADFAQADGSEGEAQFVYRLAERVDLPAHHSALVPVFARAIDARSVTLFGVDGAEPMHGLRLVNSTKQTLPAGTVALFADGGFAGEATLDRLKPGEPRYIPFGRDLDVELQRERRALGRELRALTYRGGQIEAHYVERFELALRVDNRANRARNAYIALHLPRNAEIESEASLDWDPERGEAMVEMEVPGRSHEQLRLRAGTTGVERVDPELVTDEKLAAWRQVRSLDEVTRRALATAQTARASASQDAEQLARLRRDRARQLAELERRRADLEAMGQGGSRTDAAKKTARRVEALEGELEATLAKLEAVAARREAHLEASRVALTQLPARPEGSPRHGESMGEDDGPGSRP